MQVEITLTGDSHGWLMAIHSDNENPALVCEALRLANEQQVAGALKAYAELFAEECGKVSIPTFVRSTGAAEVAMAEVEDVTEWVRGIPRRGMAEIGEGTVHHLPDDEKWQYLFTGDFRLRDGQNTNNELGNVLGSVEEFATMIVSGGLVIDSEMSRFYAYARDAEVIAKIAIAAHRRLVRWAKHELAG